MRFFVSLFLGVIVVFLAVQAFRLYEQGRDYAAEMVTLKEEQGALDEENVALKKDLEYYEDDANLAKELRSRFNYKAPDEELLIVVPEE